MTFQSLWCSPPVSEFVQKSTHFLRNKVLHEGYLIGKTSRGSDLISQRDPATHRVKWKYLQEHTDIVGFHLTKCISHKDCTIDKIEVIKFEEAKYKPKQELNCKHLCSFSKLWYFNYLEHMQPSINATGQ